MFKYDPHKPGFQYLDDLASGYWISEVLFTAVEERLFTLLEPAGKTLEEIAEELQWEAKALKRYLDTLCVLGLLNCYEGLYSNSGLSAQYLVEGKPHYLGDMILWRKYLASYWQELKACLQAGRRVNFAPQGEEREKQAARIRKYINAMDNVARAKVQELLPIFTGMSFQGHILDVGTGSGALAAGFLEKFPETQATLMDLAPVLEYTQELMEKRGLKERVTYCAANILEPWPVEERKYDLVILSNIIHAYSQEEAPFILENALKSLKPGGYILIHDYFLEHYPEKARIYDLNMLVNTYNGKIFAAQWLQEKLKELGLEVTELIPLKTDTALLIAGQKAESLKKLDLDAKSQLITRLKALGFKSVVPIRVDQVKIGQWTDMRCYFGCVSSGLGHCPPHSPTPEKTKKMLGDYRQALLLEGEPPTRSFQKLIVKAEREAFLQGYYKAFAFWAGPCALCDSCPPQGGCRQPQKARPSMEGAGIDVFATVRQAGFRLETLKERGSYAKYFGLLLLE